LSPWKIARHRIREIRGASATRRHGHPDAANAPVRVETDFVVEVEGMALARDQHVGIAIEPQLYGLAGLARAQGRDARNQRGLRLLAAETPTHATARDQHVLFRETEAMSNEMLNFADVLCGAMDVHRAVLSRDGDADLAFQVEVFLPADAQRAGEPMRGSANARGRLTAGQGARGHYE
jgi:hypothetical protein